VNPEVSGWRIWSIEGNEVTLISAGTPEVLNPSYNLVTTPIVESSAPSPTLDGNLGTIGSQLLRSRDYTMYENSYAKVGKACVLTQDEVEEWYISQFGESLDTWIFEEIKAPLEVFLVCCFYLADGRALDNGDDWLCQIHWWGDCWRLADWSSGCECAYGSGIRILVTLKDGVMIKSDAGDGSEGNPWQLTS